MSNDDLIPDPMSDLFTATLWSAPKNEPLLRSFINGTLTNAGMRQIVEAKVLNPFNIKEFVVSKSIVLDVRVKDESERFFDIEVQTSGHLAFPNRILDYWADTYSSQLARGLDFVSLRPVISIILTEFPIFPQLKNIHNVFEIRSRENPEVLLTDHLQIHFLRISEVQKHRLSRLEGIHRDLCDWLNFFAFAGEKSEGEMAALTSDNPIIQEAYAELQRFYADGEAREKIREARRFLRDYEIGMGASRAEGKAEGKADLIIRFLTRRFKAVSQEVQDKLTTLTDVDDLDHLFDLAQDCDTLEEFQKNLKCTNTVTLGGNV